MLTSSFRVCSCALFPLHLQLYLRHLANNSSPIDDPISELVRIQSAHLPGYNPAIASSIRDGPIRNLAPTFASVGRKTRKRGSKVLLIWVRRLDDLFWYERILPNNSSYRVRETVLCHTDMLLGYKHSFLIPSLSLSKVVNTTSLWAIPRK